jgi:hypothetical protein
MRLSPFFKLGSLALAVCVGAASSGCFFVDSSDGGSGNNSDNNQPPPDETPSAQPQTVGIDVDAKLNATPGDGVGVLVQYATGGHWTLSTTCDTNTSGVACGFDLFASGVDPMTTISNPQGQNLAGEDKIALQSDGSVHLSTLTSTNVNGMTFDATENATVELEMYLDGELQERFIYWVGDGVIHTGAPTNPIDFKPQVAPPKP